MVHAFYWHVCFCIVLIVLHKLDRIEYNRWKSFVRILEKVRTFFSAVILIGNKSNLGGYTENGVKIVKELFSFVNIQFVVSFSLFYSMTYLLLLLPYKFECHNRVAQIYLIKDTGKENCGWFISLLKQPASMNILRA